MEGSGAHKPKQRPPVDDHIIVPEQRAELVRGELIMSPPAGEPHGRQHVELGYLLRAHVAEGYLVALDLLTRMAETSDFAPDASIYPEARDAEGHRQLEVMAFEIVSQQRLSVATHKAKEMAGRGVRRIFCIDLGPGDVLEWSSSSWNRLESSCVIDDICLHSPLSVGVLLNAAECDNAVAKALHLRGNVYIEGLVEDSLAAGELTMLIRFAEGRLGRPLSSKESEQLQREARDGLDAVRDVILTGSPQTLATWLARRRT